jgi:DNA-binding SARP family transcriptional activator/tetratricopeptide (TPR) repeat protein
MNPDVTEGNWMTTWDDHSAVPPPRFRLLGPVEVDASDGRVLRMARRQERCMLAVLLLAVGQAVPFDRLCDLLWDGNVPARAKPAIRSHAARIRAMLTNAGAAGGTGAILVARRGGYLLAVEPEFVDAHRFRLLVEEARSAGDPAVRDRLLRGALVLWRGAALQDAASGRVRQRLCAELDELRRTAVEESLAAGLDLGRHEDLLPELARLVGAEPLHERLVELHMLALYQAGRTSDALDAYTRVRRHLAEELGVDPNPALQRLQLAILRGVPPPSRPGPPAVATGTPGQLPADLTRFAGRTGHLHELDSLLAGSGRDRVEPVVIAAIAGTAGIGKTALAVHWAHQARDRFPDGQLYVNLRGFDPIGAAVSAAEGVRRFLYALGVPAQRIPSDLGAQLDLYRSVTAGRRMLILLDNARDAEQVRPLLPGGPSSLVVVTSRTELTSLVATDGAYPLTLDLLTVEESRELLRRRLGSGRVTAEPDAVDEIITRCARLPLALAIVAARAATHPQFSLQVLADQLRDTASVLDALCTGDAASDLRTVFSWSYRALRPEAARLFRLLALHPGPDISAAAASSLAGISVARNQPVLAELTRSHLLIEHVPGRYACHDLLRSYADELGRVQDAEAGRRAAMHRIFDHYLHTAYAADRMLNPAREPIVLTPVQEGVSPVRIGSDDQALAWLTAEQAVLFDAVEHAAAVGFDAHTWQLVWALATFLERRGLWHDWAAGERAAVAATRRLGESGMLARAHRVLGYAYVELARFDDAHTQFRHALEVSCEAGDLVGQALARYKLAMALERQGRRAECLDHARHALDLFRMAGHRHGQAHALNMVGWYHALLGDHEQALAHCERALDLIQEVGDRDAEAATWDSLGYAHHHLGHHAQAVTCFQRSLDLSQTLGYRLREADTLIHLGDVHDVAGGFGPARDAWQRALTILTDLDHPDAARVRTRLASMAANASANPAG